MAKRPFIGKLLGHSQVETNARYAHLVADPVTVEGAREIAWVYTV